jgi:hypothetical protein
MISPIPNKADRALGNNGLDQTGELPESLALSSSETRGYITEVRC